MKTIIYLFSTTAIILFFSCSNPKVKVVENPYEGAWVQTYLYLKSPDTTIEKSNFDNALVKLLTKKHFAFGAQEGDIIRGGGGEYSFKEDTYIAYRKYHSNSARSKDTVVWNSKIENDLWTMSRVINMDSGKVELIEKWKRIPE